MNMIQMIWSALTSQNEPFVKIQGIPLCFLDVFISMYYFTTILISKLPKRENNLCYSLWNSR